MDTDRCRYITSDDFRAIISSSMDGFLLVDMSGNILEVNDSYCQLVGYSREQLLQMHISVVAASESQADVARRVEAIRQLGALKFESQHRHKDGTIIDVEISANYSTSDGGSIFSFCRDVSHQQRSREIMAARLRLMKYALNHSLAELLRQTLDEAESLTQSGIGFYQLHDSGQRMGTLTACSSKTAAMLGNADGSHSPSSQLGLWADCIHQRRPIIHNDTSSRRQQEFPGGSVSLVRELVVPIFRNDKIVAIMSIGNKPTDYNQQDVEVISQLVDLAWDVAERKQTDEALIREKSFLRSLIDSVDDAIFIKDTNGNYVCCNKASERLIGIAESEQIGKSDSDFFDPKFAESIQQKDRIIFAGGESVRVEETFESAQGVAVTLDSIKNPIYRPDGQLIGLVGVSRDITERKQAEAIRLELEAQLRQKYKMEAVGIMAGGIAHDFNNILAIIMTNLELMHRKIGNEHALLPRIEHAKAASLRAAELVKQILTYSRQGKQNYQPVQLAIIVEESLKLLRSTIPASIEILTRIDGEARTAMIDADSSQMEEVFINLCQNAIYAMEEKGLLSVSLRKESLQKQSCSAQLNLVSGSYLVLTVTDTGVGIPAELLDKIFDPFFTTKPVGQGTGMGLSICKSIVKKHKGGLVVDSVTDHGSAFSAYFPITSSNQVSTPQVVHDLHTEELPTGNERILLIDDEEFLAHSVSDFLVEHGYSVTIQTSSQQALALFNANPNHFDLVITDQTMPGLTGMDLSLELLKTRPELPIILCTGYSVNLTEEKALRQGVKAFFMKPLELPVLAQTVRSVFDRAKL